MADHIGTGHLNTAIGRLQAGLPVLGPWPISAGNTYEAQRLADSDFDVLVLDAEHLDFDLRALQITLQSMLNRGIIAQRGLVQNVVPLVRIPTNGGERNEWIIKQVLDLGAYGLIAPHIETVDEATAFVSASRYPVRRDAPNAGQDPPGRRGMGATVAARYWGLTLADYEARAGVWPLDPDGEILLIAMIESLRGIDNLAEICSEAPGLGAIWIGTGDLAGDMGLAGTRNHPEVQEQLLRALEICKAAGVACMTMCTTAAQVDLRYEQGFRIVLMASQLDAPYPSARPRKGSA